ncbi:MAG: hypothetical protein FWG89_08105 [Treponema sp.]|nr:hypothetical protein [Treponema sp.]
MKFGTLILLCLAVLGLNSCLGVSADISIRANGSGQIVLEYRVSQALESMGRLDGNERWPAIPVGRDDFERGVARIPGLRLSGFSARDVSGAGGGRDLLTRVTLDFQDIPALLSFLGGAGDSASHTVENGSNVLRLVLAVPSSLNADLVSLLREVSDGYEIGIGLSVPRNASLAVLPSDVSASRVVSHGRRVSFTIGLADMLDLREELTLEFRW